MPDCRIRSLQPLLPPPQLAPGTSYLAGISFLCCFLGVLGNRRSLLCGLRAWLWAQMAPLALRLTGLGVGECRGDGDLCWPGAPPTFFKHTNSIVQAASLACRDHQVLAVLIPDYWSFILYGFFPTLGDLQEYRLADYTTTLHESHSAWECRCSNPCSHQSEGNIV